MELYEDTFLPESRKSLCRKDLSRFYEFIRSYENRPLSNDTDFHVKFKPFKCSFYIKNAFGKRILKKRRKILKKAVFSFPMSFQESLTLLIRKINREFTHSAEKCGIMNIVKALTKLTIVPQGRKEV